MILAPFLTVSAVTALVVWRLPDRYQCDATILVVPQRVPDAYVRSTVSTPNDRTNTIQDRIESTTHQILSRARLERMINDLSLYPKEQRRDLFEDVLQKMRDSIEVQPATKGDAFVVSFTYEDRRLALEVVNRLAAAFIDESNEDRTLFAEATTDFLQTQLDDARRRLEELDKRVAAYRTQHAGELPSEQSANLTVLANTQSQLQAISESINRDRDRRYLLERTLTELASEVPVTVPVAPAGVSPADTNTMAGQTAAEQLESARAARSALAQRYKPDHPEMKRLALLISDLEAKAQQEALQKPLSPDSVPDRPVTAAEAQRQSRMRDMRIEIDGIDRVIASRQQDEKAMRAKLAEYQHRVEATPERETEMTSLLRDYSTVQQHYASLLAKQEDSKISAALERRQMGTQFRLVEPPRLPQKPVWPNRPMIDLAGAAAGMLLGLGMIGFLEFRDDSFKTDDEVVRLLALPVVATIPLMLTGAERRVEGRRTLLVAAATALVGLAAAAGALWWFWWRQL